MSYFRGSSQRIAAATESDAYKIGIGTAAIYQHMRSGTFPRPLKAAMRLLWIASKVNE